MSGALMLPPLDKDPWKYRLGAGMSRMAAAQERPLVAKTREAVIF